MSKNVLMKQKINDELVDILPKTSSELVYTDSTTTLDSLIPDEASSTNKLADKSYVDDKIPTAATTSALGLVKPDGETITISNGVISANTLAYNIAQIQCIESQMAGYTLTATNINNSNDSFSAVCDTNGKCLLEVGVGTYNVLGRKGSTIFKATVTTQGGVKSTATLSEFSYPSPTGNLILGYDIDEEESDPEDRITYTDDMKTYIDCGFTAEWVFENVTQLANIKPCLLDTNGNVTTYLDKTNYAKDTDGNDSDVDDSEDNVMVEFPKIYWYVYKEDTIIHCKIANYKVNDNYKALAHLRGTEEQDKIYIGAYLGYKNSNDVLKSWSGVIPTTELTSSDFRTCAQANGTNYQKMTFYMYTMLQLLFILRYKSTDCQTTLGLGYVSELNDNVINTGNTNAKGFNYGSNNGAEQIKFLGIEDAWGNLFQLVDGLYTDSEYNIITTTGSFSDFDGDNKITTPTGLSNYKYGYIKNVMGTTETPFVVKAEDGSGASYYCDCACLCASCLLFVGGSWDHDSTAGLFCVSVYYSSSSSSSDVGSRICYL